MIENTPKFAVLLSSYNGEKFIAEQIQSILDQQDVQLHLFVRDDGSHDQTVEILNQFALNDHRVSIKTGKNKGVVQSFFQLLVDAPQDFDYYAFADQDDVWKVNKLHNAFLSLNKAVADTPAMYYSRLEFTDEQLNTIGFSIIPSNRGFNNAIVQNQATGCTIVINKKAREIIIDRLPTWALMHDWWIYLVVSATGEIFYDEYPGILYRKHGNNVTPATPWFAMEILARIKRYLRNKNVPQKVTDQANEFQKQYHDLLTTEQQEILHGFLTARASGFFKRLKYVLAMPVRRNTKADNFILKILILIGRF